MSEQSTLTPIKMKPVHRSATDLIREMQGLPKDWGIEGYSAPKYGHLSRNPSYTVQKQKRKQFDCIVSHLKENPDPHKYKPKYDTDIRPKAKDTFRKAAKETIIGEIMRQQAKLPGPSSYNRLAKNKIRHGKFDKDQHSDFYSETVYRSQQSPSPHQYKKEDALQKLERRSPQWSWDKETKNKQIKQQQVGPGSYPNAPNAYLSTTKKRSFSTIIRSGNPKIGTEQGKFTPGVGHYTLADEGLDKTMKSQRTFSVPRQRLVRMTERLANDKKFIPGPGSYNIMN